MNQTFVDIAIETLLWSTPDTDNGDNFLARYNKSDFSESALAAVAGLVEAIVDTAPEGYVTEDAVRKAVLDVGLNGSGLWDDYHEDWAGEGEAWSKRLRADPRTSNFGDCGGICVGEDGKIYVYGHA